MKNSNNTPEKNINSGIIIFIFREEIQIFKHNTVLSTTFTMFYIRSSEVSYSSYSWKFSPLPTSLSLPHHPAPGNHLQLSASKSLNFYLDSIYK